MRRIAPLFFAALIGATVLHPQQAFAGPDPAKLKAASESFDAGARAFSANRFDEAGDHFEAADAAAPSARVLQLAIKSRRKSNQLARAATLAALALERYGSDKETKKLADETIAELAGKLHRVGVSCVSPCLLAAGSKIVHGEAATRWTVYLTPGKTTIGASFVGNLTAKDQPISATAGGTSTLRFAPPRDGSSGGAEPGGGGSAGTGGGDQGGPSQGGEGAAGGGTGEGGASDGGLGEGGSGDGSGGEAKSDWRIHPAFFFVGLGITAGLGGATIWSGIDTINEPGTDRVRQECAGQGETCPLYQEALDKELRTNVLIGATAGAAAVTLVLGIVGKWSSDEEEAPVTPDTVAFDLPRLWVDVDGAKGTETVGVHLQLGGRF